MCAPAPLARPRGGVPLRAAPDASGPAPCELASLKRRRVVAPVARGEMARESSAGRAGAEEFSAPTRKRAKVAHDDVGVEMGVLAVDPAPELFRKRMASELDALRNLVKKAELLCRGKNGQFLATGPRAEAPMEEDGKAMSAKRRKVCPVVEQIEAPRMPSVDKKQSDRHGGGGEATIELHPVEDSVLSESKTEQHKFAGESKMTALPEEEGELVDVCGGVFPVAIPEASSPVLPEEAGETGNGPCSSSDSGSYSCDSDSGSDSGSESDSDESVNSPAPAAVLDEESNSPVLLPVEDEEDECVEICGGVSPSCPIAIQEISPLGSPEKAGAGNSPSSSSESGSSSPSDSDATSSSGSDSDEGGSDNDSGSESDSDESVNSPAPASDPTSAQPPPPSPELEVVQITEPEKLQEKRVEPAPAVPPYAVQAKPQDNHRAAPMARPMATMIAKAQEALEIRRKQGKGWEREKVRRELLEMERTALPDESIHPRDMEQLGIAKFEYIVSTARPPVSGGRRSAPRGRPSILQQLGFFLKADA
ncbi:hypothetical protein ACP70R_026693 [Stipagrostis hirtigluma subsp. patula]